MNKMYNVTIDGCGIIRAQLIDENTTDVVFKFKGGISVIEGGHWPQLDDAFMIVKKDDILDMKEVK